MTPQEKAKELISKMYGATPARESSELIDLDRKTSIQCALIAVDEILNTIYDEDFEGHLLDEIGAGDYWREVKETLRQKV